MHWESFSFFFVTLKIQTCSGNRNNLLRCKEMDLVLYNLVFETHWTRQLFPKQYPGNGPPPHWSKMIGMTHGENYILSRIGKVEDKNFKGFAELGKIDVPRSQKKLHVLDEFSTPSIRRGVGKTHVNFFADGNHSLVSLAVKIVPSPDWFVGVDSLALCTEGNWLDSVTMRFPVGQASPMNAGTESGFTFTSRNWKTTPQQRIFKWPNHPANSFYYPKLRDLPAIATFHFVKKTLYQLRRKVRSMKGNQKMQRKLLRNPFIT